MSNSGTEQQPWVELKNLRDELALTLPEMAALAGYSATYLSNLETGWRVPSRHGRARIIARIAKAAKVSRASLQPGAADSTRPGAAA